MDTTNWKKKLGSHVGDFMLVLLVAQPLLDVASYFMQGAGATLVTTGVRCLLLAVVSGYGFLLSSRKRAYAALYGVVAGFWLLHMLNCLRIGYADPVGDTAEYLKLVQLPLWTFSFVTFFREREELARRCAGLLAVNFAIVLAVIGLSFATGHPGYTYNMTGRGVQMGLLGWFGVPNAQSAIVCMLAAGLLLWAFRTENLWVFCGACVLGFGLLYFTGTRLTYYTALLLAAAFIMLILISRQHYRFCFPLLAALVLLAAFRGVSVMAQHSALSSDSWAIYQEKADQVLGEGWDFTYREGEEIPPEKLEKIRQVYTEVYGEKEGVYGGALLGDLYDRFGVDRVMAYFDYSVKPSDLYDMRSKRRAVLGLVWEEKDALTKLLGFEYGESWINGQPYDLENDFPALPYYYGWLGTALYVAFIAYFLLSALKGFVQNLGSLPEFLTMELGAYGLIFCIALGAAQFSGNVLRKPNVLVYFSLAAAQIFCQLHPRQQARVFSKYLRKPTTTIKAL